MYELIQDNDAYMLNVVCGGVGLYEVSVRLHDEELERFKEGGVDYLEGLVREVTNDPLRYAHRHQP